jgi:hypothetical protein
MINCNTCGCPGICLATIDDHIVNGECREIVGCDADRFFYGKLLSDVPYYWRYKSWE